MREARWWSERQETDQQAQAHAGEEIWLVGGCGPLQAGMVLALSKKLVRAAPTLQTDQTSSRIRFHQASPSFRAATIGLVWLQSPAPLFSPAILPSPRGCHEVCLIRLTRLSLRRDVSSILASNIATACPQFHRRALMIHRRSKCFLRNPPIC